MNAQDQITTLNQQIKAEIGVSKIHGVGVIAVTKIRQGEQVFADRMPRVYDISYGNFGKLFPHVREIVLKRWPSVVNGSKFIYPDARLLSFMNHSRDANYDPKTDTALRDVEIGAELVEDYTIMPNYEKIWPPNKNKWISAEKNQESSISAKKEFLQFLYQLPSKLKFNRNP